jgi:putative GTP pyrophosphokinase
LAAGVDEPAEPPGGVAQRLPFGLAEVEVHSAASGGDVEGGPGERLGVALGEHHQHVRALVHAGHVERRRGRRVSGFGVSQSTTSNPDGPQATPMLYGPRAQQWRIFSGSVLARFPSPGATRGPSAAGLEREDVHRSSRRAVDEMGVSGEAVYMCRGERASEKIKRKGGKYADPLRDMTDLVGLRVITYYQEDVEKVGELIRAAFSVDEENSVDKSSDLAPDRFGYASIHYVVSLGADRAELGEWRIFKGTRAEIQVRTVLQHAWAAVNHKLDYKSEGEIPDVLQRRLFRLSALFELADEQFSSIKDARREISESYTTVVKDGNFDLPLNLTSFTAYVYGSARMAELDQRATGSKAPSNNADPKQRSRDRRALLEVLRECDFATLSQLDDYFGSDSFKRAFKVVSGIESMVALVTLEFQMTWALVVEKNRPDLAGGLWGEAAKSATESIAGRFHSARRPKG